MTTGHSAAEFREKHDKTLILHKRVKAALKQLPNDRWLYEGDFLKLAKLANVQWGQIADAYADYVVLAKSIGTGKKGNGRRVICGSKELALSLREVAAV